MEKPDFNSHLREKVSTNIEVAMNNAITRERLFVLEDELDKLGRGRSDEALAREDKIEQEMLTSSVTAETLAEFKEVLTQVGKMHRKSEEWAEEVLAHENAHANVGEAVGYEMKEYIVLFSKDEAGGIYSQPAVLSKSNKNWGTIEKAMRDILIYEAPQKYGEVMSHDDTEMAERAHLKLKLFGGLHPLEVEKVKNELGDLWA